MQTIDEIKSDILLAREVLAEHQEKLYIIEADALIKVLARFVNENPTVEHISIESHEESNDEGGSYTYVSTYVSTTDGHEIEGSEELLYHLKIDGTETQAIVLAFTGKSGDWGEGSLTRDEILSRG